MTRKIGFQHRDVERERSWRGEWELENGRLDDHVDSFAKASAFAKATADESEAKEQVEREG